MRKTSRLKGSGYFTSTISVVLLAIPALKSAVEDEAMLLSLVAGALLSIVGMALRWRSHRLEQHEKDAIAAEVASPMADHPTNPRLVVTRP